MIDLLPKMLAESETVVELPNLWTENLLFWSPQPRRSSDLTLVQKVTL